jgi:hypothetical protein
VYPGIPTWVRDLLTQRFGNDFPTDFGRKQRGNPPFDARTDDHWPYGYWERKYAKKLEVRQREV